MQPSSLQPNLFQRAAKSCYRALRRFIRTLVPTVCPVCHKQLKRYENFICLPCLCDAPFTNMWLTRDNYMEQRYWGSVPIVRAASLLWYMEGSKWREAIHNFKYHNDYYLGERFGRMMAVEFSKADFFKDIDTIIPIPLHPQRRFDRYYNQSEYLAQGISNYTGINIDLHSVIRIVNNPPQVKLGLGERIRYTNNIFSVPNPQNLEGRHILLVDDVFTSGSTTISCARAIMKACNDNVRISVATFAATQQMRGGE